MKATITFEDAVEDVVQPDGSVAAQNVIRATLGVDEEVDPNVEPTPSMWMAHYVMRLFQEGILIANTQKYIQFNQEKSEEEINAEDATGDNQGAD